MNQLEFEQLCRDASLALGIADTGALGEGFTVQFEDVLFETSFREGQQSFLLMAELGTVAAPDREAVFENLFTIQLMTWKHASLRFGFNPARRTVVLCIEAKFAAHCNSAWLATLVRSVGAQAIAWRDTLLVGNVTAANDEQKMPEYAFAHWLSRPEARMAAR